MISQGQSELFVLSGVGSRCGVSSMTPSLIFLREKYIDN